MTDPSVTWTQPSLGTGVPVGAPVGGGSGFDMVPPPHPARAAQAIIQNRGFRITRFYRARRTPACTATAEPSARNAEAGGPDSAARNSGPYSAATSQSRRDA